MGIVIWFGRGQVMGVLDVIHNGDPNIILEWKSERGHNMVADAAATLLMTVDRAVQRREFSRARMAGSLGVCSAFSRSSAVLET